MCYQKEGRWKERLTPCVLRVGVPTRDKSLLHLFLAEVPVDQVGPIVVEANWIVSNPPDRAPRNGCYEAEGAEDMSHRPIPSRGSCRPRRSFWGGISGGSLAPVSHFWLG